MLVPGNARGGSPLLEEPAMRKLSTTLGGLVVIALLAGCQPSAPKVMAHVTEGRSHHWIARDLGISKNTVDYGKGRRWAHLF